MPKTIVENFLSETYYGEFALRDTDFYIEQGYYIWEYEFTDEEGIDFCEYYRHPVERSLDNPGKYVFFDRNRTGGVYDFYWQEKMCRECTDELILKKYQVNEGSHSGRIRYSFDLQEEDNDEIVNIVTKLYTYVFRNTKKPENVPLGCTIKYGEKYLYSIGADETDAIYLYAGYEDEKILDYITQRLNTEWQNHFCLLTEENENYILHIKDINGNTIFKEECETEPIVTRINDDTLMIIRGKGDWHTYTFVNVRTSLVSENFDDVSAWNHQKVAYATYEEGAIKIIVQDIYDKEKYYEEIIRDYTPVAIPHHVILNAEFVNHSQLMLDYYSGENYEVKKEIIEL